MERIKDLALYGGMPVYSGEWPAWPAFDAETEGLVLEALRSSRWAISEMNNGQELYERRFARDFADYHNMPYCVPTSSGTSALTIAFEALGLPRGAEVLVPGVTWVACASAVAALGLVPVLVDIDPQTLCISTDALEAAIGHNTEAILIVHYMCNVADLGEILQLCQRHSLALVEDCAQAHGARFEDSPVGSFGVVSTFSMQNSKVLTSGEGGACLTRDPQLAERLQQYRADGRSYRATWARGVWDLEERGDVQGRNLSLSEIQSAVLLGRLRRLDPENEHRRAMASLLDEALADAKFICTVDAQDGATQRTFYRYCFRVDSERFSPRQIDSMRTEIAAEIGYVCYPLHDPLNANRLYNPLKSPQKYDAGLLKRLDPSAFVMPNAARARDEYITIPHPVLLAEERVVHKVAEGILKVVAANHADRVPSPR